MIGCAWGLTACQSTQNPNQAQFLTQKIYHAPAQSYDFDLGSSILRGELKMKQACSVKGTSLDILDQLQQQVRLDTINLNNNSELQLTSDSALKDIVPKVLALYEAQYKATATAPKGYKSHIGDVAMSRLSSGTQNIDILVLTQYGSAYVLQLNSPFYANDAEKGKQQLQTLLKSLQIPGKKLANSDHSLPINFDLSNTDQTARRAWQQTYCS